MNDNLTYFKNRSNLRRSNSRSRRNKIHDKLTYISYDLSCVSIHLTENNNKSQDVVLEVENYLEESKFENI